MGLILKKPKSSFFILRKRQNTLFISFQVHFRILIIKKHGFVVSYGWYNFFQLGLVSQSDKHCKLAISRNDNKIDLGLV